MQTQMQVVEHAEFGKLNMLTFGDKPYGAKCILQVRGERPFFSSKYDITKHKNYKLLADTSDKNIFDIDKHLSTILKLKPDDEYDVFEIDLDNEKS